MRIGKKSHRVLDNGVILTNRPDFREIAAVTQSGQYYVVEGGHQYQPTFRNAVEEFVRLNIAPRATSSNTQVVTSAALRELYGSSRESAASAAGGIDTAITKLNKVLSDAARAKASDVKIIQSEARTIIRIKVGGKEFSSSMSWTVSEGAVAMSTIFDARDDGTGHATSIDNSFQSFSVSPGAQKLRLPEGVVKLRGQKGFHEVDVGTGVHMVLRFFYSDDAQVATSTLESLGFDEETSRALALARAKLSGGIIIAGATGDGKSTTLIRVLERLYEEHAGQLSIVTIEDPVEYRIHGDGIVQIPVKSAGSGEERSAAFRQALMHFVRINPDVGSISEIRDADAAREVLQFVATGHQVWSTIHGSTAHGILFRLIEMGIPPEELCKPGSIELLMKQSLAPVLCPDCRLPFAGTMDSRKALLGRQLGELGIDPGEVRVRNPEGCRGCRPDSGDPVALAAWSGYLRLVAVAEVILPNEGYFERVRALDSFDALKYWLAPVEQGGMGGTPLPGKLSLMVSEGQLDPFDAIRKGTDFSKVKQEWIPVQPAPAPPIDLVRAAAG